MYVTKQLNAKTKTKTKLKSNCFNFYHKICKHKGQLFPVDQSTRILTILLLC